MDEESVRGYVFEVDWDRRRKREPDRVTGCSTCTCRAGIWKVVKFGGAELTIDEPVLDEYSPKVFERAGEAYFVYGDDLGILVAAVTVGAPLYAEYKDPYDVVEPAVSVEYRGFLEEPGTRTCS